MMDEVLAYIAAFTVYGFILRFFIIPGVISDKIAEELDKSKSYYSWLIWVLTVILCIAAFIASYFPAAKVHDIVLDLLNKY